MGKKKTGAAKRCTNQPELLAAVVQSQGGGAKVAKKLGCSQQSVSEWTRGSWPPRLPIQKKMEKLYGIPAPWPLKGKQ